MTDVGNTLNLNNKSRIKETDKSYRTLKCENYNQNNVKVFTYLICSDKSEADTVANKGQTILKIPSFSSGNNKDNNENKENKEEKEENNNIKTQNENRVSMHNIKSALKKKDSFKETNINSFHNFIQKTNVKYSFN